MTKEEKKQAEKYLDYLYSKAIKVPNKVNEDVYLVVRNLLNSMDLFWHRDKQGKHHIF